MDGIYVMVANKRSTFLFTLPSFLFLYPIFFYFCMCRFVCKRNSCVWVQLSVFWNDQNHQHILQSEWLWVKNVLGMIPFWISKEMMFLCEMCIYECVAGWTSGFSSIEKCILLSWPSNLVILWIKVINVSIERILKCMILCVSIFFHPWMDDNSHKSFAVWC